MVSIKIEKHIDALDRKMLIIRVFGKVRKVFIF